MSNEVELGFSGLSVPAGTHFCAFFRGKEERNAIVAPFLREGVRSGARCVGILDGASEAAIAQELGIEADPPQLDLRLSSQFYDPDAGFTRPEMVTYWEAEAADTLVSGAWPFARYTGEMTVAVNQAIPVEDWVGYESDVNRFAKRYPQVLLCLYDLLDFGTSRLFMDILKTHRMVLMGDTILENMYFVEPDEFDRMHA
jgi:hypothetical protein